jgi:hypothetical protein
MNNDQDILARHEASDETPGTLRTSPEQDAHGDAVEHDHGSQASDDYVRDLLIRGTQSAALANA